MNPLYFGDSYDLVKRFFCTELASIGYEIIIDPLFTGDWHEAEHRFYHLVNPAPTAKAPSITKPRALFLDPDTGIHLRAGKKHVSFDRIAQEAQTFQLVFSFDQSFSRSYSSKIIIRDKLLRFNTLGCHAMYYDSHARFLFASTAEQSIIELRSHLLLLGLPSSRLILNGA